MLQVVSPKTTTRNTTGAGNHDTNAVFTSSIKCLWSTRTRNNNQIPTSSAASFQSKDGNTTLAYLCWAEPFFFGISDAFTPPTVAYCEIIFCTLWLCSSFSSSQLKKTKIQWRFVQHNLLSDFTSHGPTTAMYLTLFENFKCNHSSPQVSFASQFEILHRPEMNKQITGPQYSKTHQLQCVQTQSKDMEQSLPKISAMWRSHHRHSG